MRISTTVDGRIDAAHAGPFGDRFHGHTWTVRVWFYSRRNRPIDATVRQAALDAVIGRLDHRAIDEVLGRDYATCEGMAVHILRELRKGGAFKVRVAGALGGRGAEAEL